jgi:hypothetical protein
VSIGPALTPASRRCGWPAARCRGGRAGPRSADRDRGDLLPHAAAQRGGATNLTRRSDARPPSDQAAGLEAARHPGHAPAVARHRPRPACRSARPGGPAAPRSHSCCRPSTSCCCTPASSRHKRVAAPLRPAGRRRSHHLPGVRAVGLRRSHCPGLERDAPAARADRGPPSTWSGWMPGRPEHLKLAREPRASRHCPARRGLRRGMTNSPNSVRFYQNPDRITGVDSWVVTARMHEPSRHEAGDRPVGLCLVIGVAGRPRPHHHREYRCITK